jgi:hypothetical protein
MAALVRMNVGTSVLVGVCVNVCEGIRVCVEVRVCEPAVGVRMGARSKVRAGWLSLWGPSRPRDMVCTVVRGPVDIILVGMGCIDGVCAPQCAQVVV